MESKIMLLIALGVLLVPWMVGRPSTKLTVEPSYKYEGTVADAFLDPSGDRLYIVHESGKGFRIVDWRRNVTVADVDFSRRLPVSETQDESGVISWIEVINGSDWALVKFAGSVYRTNRHTWEIAERLGDVGVDVSKSRGWAVVVRNKPGSADFEASLFATKDWKRVNSWIIPASGNARLGGEFVAGDRYLAVATFTNEVCRIDFYSIPSGKFSRSLDFHQHGTFCPASVSFFYPTDEDVFVSEEFFERSIVFWDTNTAKRIRQIKEQTHLRNATISADGRWLFGSVREKGPDAGWRIKIWDARTGEEAYHHSRYSKAGGDIPYARFSDDGQYLLVGTTKSLTVYHLEMRCLKSS